MATPKGLRSDTCSVPTIDAPDLDLGGALHRSDYAIMSRGFHENVAVRAMNFIEEWGPATTAAC